MTCKIDNCIKPIQYKSLKICNVHYHRWYRNKSFDINPTWPNLKKGQKQLTNYGYYRIHINGKRILEHRYIIEQHLGRKLLPTEKIHHKNHIKTDNRLENLKIVTQSEHIKNYHRKKPLVDWSKVIVPPKASRWHPSVNTNCLIPNCSEPVESRSLCWKHFVSWRRNGK